MQVILLDQAGNTSGNTLRPGRQYPQTRQAISSTHLLIYKHDKSILFANIFKWNTNIWRWIPLSLQLHVVMAIKGNVYFCCTRAITLNLVMVGGGGGGGVNDIWHTPLPDLLHTLLNSYCTVVACVVMRLINNLLEREKDWNHAEDEYHGMIIYNSVINAL